MNTRPRIISIFTLVLFALLLSSVTLISLNPVSGTVISTNEQKGLLLLSNVINLNLSSYNVSTTFSHGTSNSLYLHGIDEQDISYTLVSNYANPLPVIGDIGKNGSSTNNTRFPPVHSGLNVLCTFVNDNLQMLYIRERVGVQALSQSPTDNTPIGLAKTFLANYKQYTGNTLYSNLGSSVSSDDTNKNITRTIGNARLEILALNEETTFKWTYNSNGALAPSRFIALGFKDGLLSYFVDNWQLYTVGTTNVSVPEEQAKSIALTSAKQHYLSLNPNDSAASGFNASNLYFTTLVMDSSLGANNTRGDASTLYPVWRVGVALNQWYGNIYGITVDIWADNGKIRSIREEYSSLTPQLLQSIKSNASIEFSTVNTTDVSPDFIQNMVQPNIAVNSVDFMFMAMLPTLGATTIVSLLLIRKKKVFSANSMKKFTPKWLASLIVMSMLTMLFTQIAIASALPSSGGTVWGSESTGQLSGYSGPPYPYAAYWRKTSEEISAQRSNASFIQTQFASTGTFSVCNHQGSLGSDKNTILGDIYSTSGYISLTSNYARVSVVQFDHGVGLSSDTGYTEGIFHYMFEDNDGTRRGPFESQTNTNLHGVFDADIYQKTSAVAPDGITFAFINSCLSADYNNSYGALNNDPYYINYNITQGILPDGSCRSLPYAFMHRVIMDPTSYGFNAASHMSNNGYSNPDHGSQVYIGYGKGSASLSQYIPFYNNNASLGEPYWAWVDRFFAAAVSNGNSVNNALDLASIQTWGSSFGNSPLSTGFTPYWPINHVNDTRWPTTCTMSVYGNGLIQLNSFSNMFVDHNYNNWAVNWGTWSAASGDLVNSRGPSMITTNSAFPTNRHVRVTVTTTQAGSNNWDVPWIVAKLGSGGIDYNSVYGLIHTDGTVELAAMLNGQKYMWQTPSSLNPFTSHVIDIDTVGNVGYMYVDGVLYHKQDNACFGSFGGQTALLTAGNSAGAFNKVSVLGQSIANTRWTDNFDDNSLNTNLWASIQVNGGTVQETQQQLSVKKLSGGGSWSQAGVVSQNSYNMQGACVSINVSKNGPLDTLEEMQLLIGTTKSTAGDPVNTNNNLYRIGLMRDQSDTIVIQRRVNGVFTTVYSNPWLSATGQLSILVLNGVITFYENNNFLYYENYALPSSNCYIYAYASSRTIGTNAFDNFEYVKTS